MMRILTTQVRSCGYIGAVCKCLLLEMSQQECSTGEIARHQQSYLVF